MQRLHGHSQFDTTSSFHQCSIRVKECGSRALVGRPAVWPSQRCYHSGGAVASVKTAAWGHRACNRHLCMFQSNSNDYPQHGEQAHQDQHQQTQHKQQEQLGSRWHQLQDMLQRYGPGSFFSYITFSNVMSVTMLSSAWLLYTRSTGFTPLQVGQWPRFLVFYAGAYAVTHLARPLKLAIGLAGTPVGSAAVNGVCRLLKCSTTVALVVLFIVEAVLLLCCLGAVVVYSATLTSTAALA